MRWNVAFVLVACLLTAADAPRNDDRERLQGTWVCVSMERNGAPIPPEKYKDGKLFMEGDTFTYKLGNRVVVRGIRKLDPSRTPRALDDTHTEGTFKGKTYLGIYELNGDTFKTCNGGPGQDRPKSFATKPRSGLLLVVYKRAAP